MTDQEAAAWRPDPEGRADYRWWDGVQWTNHVATDGVASVDPLPVPEAPKEPPHARVDPSAAAAGPPSASEPKSETTISDQVDDPAAAGLEDSTEQTRRRAGLLPALLAGVAAVSIIGGAALLVRGGSSDPATVQALLEPAAALGPDPFTEQFAAQPVITIPAGIEAPLTAGGTATGPPQSLEPTTSSTEPGNESFERGAAFPVARVNAATPGLYGGTQDNDRCNTSQLRNYLADQPEKANAWVGALNGDDTVAFAGSKMTADDIGGYIDTLTPVVLLADTLVVNHGYDNGEATPHDAVLQKGSAVLVDEQGIPRTRCACGNPLTRPSSSATQVEPQGTPWPGFNPNKVAIVEPIPGELATLDVVDLDSGLMFQRPIGTKGERDVPPSTTTIPTTTTTTTTAPTTETTVVLGTGDVQATLRWATDSDLDLHVIGPDGEEISFDSPTSTSGGQLDVDDVPNEGDDSAHVENVFWPPGEAPNGTYRVWVEHYSGSASGYTLEVLSDGEVVHSESATLGVGDDSAAFEFDR